MNQYPVGTHDEDVFTLQAVNLLESLLQALGDLDLVSVAVDLVSSSLLVTLRLDVVLTPWRDPEGARVSMLHRGSHRRVNEMGTHKMAVAGLKGLIDALSDLTEAGLPGAIAQSASRRQSDQKLCCWRTHGIWAPVLRVALFPKDMMGKNEE
jgi:hypothetical protein